MVASSGTVPTIHSAEQPSESEYKGKWRNIKDGYLYRHCVADGHPRGKIFKAMIPAQVSETEKDSDGKPVVIHTGLFWEGTEEEFHAIFRKE